ncbi:nuclear transport factor 2 family protein [Nonomuraea sp. ZG12]|uniref:nuclear transport factor 2 family protein n=1 Tax=Nonomuraea sp. ZG12 TaxID=3452207 RepID=UPI003F88FBEC
MSDTVSTPQSTDSVRAAAQQTFRNHLDHLAAGRIAEWGELFTEDGVLEFPYAPKGYPARIVGRQELRGHLRSFSENFRVEFTDLRFHETVDPSLVIAELKSEGVALATGRPYNQTYISVVETKDGRFSRYVDFWNPQVAIEALGGGTDDMVSAFSD